jgi:hypothetical protein
MKPNLIALTLAAALLAPGAYAGPLMKEATTQYALSELADVAIANSRCDLEPPAAHFQLLLALNRKGWTDEADANLAVVGAYEAGRNAYDAMSKPQRLAKCKEIAEHYQSIDPTPRAPRLADGPECKALRDRMMQATGAEFRRVSPSGERVFLYHPISDEINLSCAAHGSTPDVFIGWDKGASPSKAWVALAVKVGQAVTNEPAKALRDGIEKCYHDALKDPTTEMADVELPKSKIECQAFARDGGAGSMTFFVDTDRESPQ